MDTQSHGCTSNWWPHIKQTAVPFGLTTVPLGNPTNQYAKTPSVDTLLSIYTSVTMQLPVRQLKGGRYATNYDTDTIINLGLKDIPDNLTVGFLFVE